MSKILPLPSFSYLNECFSYDKETGLLTWKNRPRTHFNTDRGHQQFNDFYCGNVAGVQKNTGVKVIRLNGQNTQVRRIIWKIVYGDDPQGVVYALNGVVGDDRLDNLCVKGMDFGNKKSVAKGLPEGLEYDRERIMWGSKYIGWYRTKTQAIEWLYSLSAV